jgi:hypothetical protein
VCVRITFECTVSRKIREQVILGSRRIWISWHSVLLRSLFPLVVDDVKLNLYTVFYLHVECFVCVFSDCILHHFAVLLTICTLSCFLFLM